MFVAWPGLLILELKSLVWREVCILGHFVLRRHHLLETTFKILNVYFFYFILFYFIFFTWSGLLILDFKSQQLLDGRTVENKGKLIPWFEFKTIHINRATMEILAVVFITRGKKWKSNFVRYFHAPVSILYWKIVLHTWYRNVTSFQNPYFNSWLQVGDFLTQCGQWL